MKKHEVAEFVPKATGTSVFRREDAKLLTGRGKYIADIQLPNMRHVAILRSPFAHARIVSIDTSQAAAIPGVELIWTGEDTAPLTIGIPTRHADPAFQATIQPVLAQGVVRYVGEAVAVVVATSIHVAEDALAEIMVEYEELPAIA